MKAIKTAAGMKKIRDEDTNQVPFQLKMILQEHRLVLINKLITGDLASYIDYKFSAKALPSQIEKIKDALENLKHSDIDLEFYQSVFEAVKHNEFTSLNNTVFYAEIDSTIKTVLFQPDLFSEVRQPSFN